jgi:hypothetical protein
MNAKPLLELVKRLGSLGMTERDYNIVWMSLEGSYFEAGFYHNLSIERTRQIVQKYLRRAASAGDRFTNPPKVEQPAQRTPIDRLSTFLPREVSRMLHASGRVGPEFEFWEDVLYSLPWYRYNVTKTKYKALCAYLGKVLPEKYHHYLK